MAVLALTNAKCVINSVDLSDHITGVEVSVQAEDLETTAFGATYKARIGGLLDGSVKFTFNQDYASSKVDATIFPLLGTSTAVTVAAVNTTIAATNPEYRFSAIVTEYMGVGGSVGELAKVDVTWPTTGTVTRAVTP